VNVCVAKVIIFTGTSIRFPSHSGQITRFLSIEVMNEHLHDFSSLSRAFTGINNLYCLCETMYSYLEEKRSWLLLY